MNTAGEKRNAQQSVWDRKAHNIGRNQSLKNCVRSLTRELMSNI